MVTWKSSPAEDVFDPDSNLATATLFGIYPFLNAKGNRRRGTNQKSGTIEIVFHLSDGAVVRVRVYNSGNFVFIFFSAFGSIHCYPTYPTLTSN